MPILDPAGALPLVTKPELGLADGPGLLAIIEVCFLRSLFVIPASRETIVLPTALAVKAEGKEVVGRSDEPSRGEDRAPLEVGHVSEPSTEDDRLATLARLDVQTSPALNPNVAMTFGLNAEQEVDRTRREGRNPLQRAIGAVGVRRRW